jgi:hypothetical protein
MLSRMHQALELEVHVSPTLNFTCHAGTGLNRVMHAMRLVSTEKAWPDKGITNSLDTSQLAQVFVID